MLAHWCHSEGEYDAEVIHLETVLKLDAPIFAPQAHLRLAITFEHKLKDLPRALHHAKLTIDEEGYSASLRRQERVATRMDRRTGRE
jgi:hypothetical protein